MKNILLLVHDDEGQESRLQVALDIVRSFNGHLECLDVLAYPMIVYDYYGSGANAVLMAEMREQAAEHRKQLEARLIVEGIPWTMGATFGTVVDALEGASRLADLIVLSSRDQETEKRSSPQRLPLKAERPVLAVPPGCKGLNTSGKVLVAWDGSRPCNEAVRAAIPLLKEAAEVILLEVNQPEGAFAMTEIATYLSRHGIPTELVERNTEEQIADAILSYAAGCKADFLVMGAYSLPSAAEAVFGGVTRSMLLKAEVPLLLAH